MVAHLEPELYRQFYAIAKEQAGNATFNKWDDYGVIINKEILNKIQNFVPINEYNKSSKGFRTSKSGRNTGIFQKIENINNNHAQDEGFIGRNNIVGEFASNVSNNRINIIPKLKTNIEPIIDDADE